MENTIIEQVDQSTIRVTKTTSMVTEYDIPTLLEKRARIVEWTAKYVAERNAEIAEIDNIINAVIST